MIADRRAPKRAPRHFKETDTKGNASQYERDRATAKTRIRRGRVAALGHALRGTRKRSELEDRIP
jgi:hypothetical protein